MTSCPVPTHTAAGSANRWNPVQKYRWHLSFGLFTRFEFGCHERLLEVPPGKILCKNTHVFSIFTGSTLASACWVPNHSREKRIRSALRTGVMKHRLVRQNRCSPFHTALCNLRDSHMTNQHLSFSSSIQSTFPFNLAPFGRESALQLGSVR